MNKTMYIQLKIKLNSQIITMKSILTLKKYLKSYKRSNHFDIGVCMQISDYNRFPHILASFNLAKTCQ